MSDTMNEPVFFQFVFSSGGDPIRGFMDRVHFEEVAKKWEARGTKPPTGLSRILIDNFFRQIGKPPVPGLRIDLDQVAVIEELTVEKPRRRLGYNEALKENLKKKL